MGRSVDAYLRFGYVLPELDWEDYDENAEDDEESEDVEALWVRANAPESVTSLALTPEESAEYNAIPYDGNGNPAWDKRTEEQKVRTEYFRAKSSVYYKAKSEWLKDNPCEVQLDWIGSYEGEEKFLLYAPGGKAAGIRASWEAAPLDLNDPDLKVDVAEVKAKLDAVCTLLGRKPPEDDPAWYLYPLAE